MSRKGNNLPKSLLFLVIFLAGIFAIGKFVSLQTDAAAGYVFIPDGWHINSGTPCSYASQTGNCFTSLQTAIDGAIGGATLTLTPGTYQPTAANPYHPGSEAFLIDRPLVIQGADLESTIVQPADNDDYFADSADTLASGVNLFIIQSDNVHISGLTFNGDNPLASGTINAQSAISVDYNIPLSITNLSISGNAFTNFYGYGVNVANQAGQVSGVTVHENEFAGIAGASAAAGIKISGANSGIAITFNSFDNSTTGVHSDLGSGVQLYKNTFNNIVTGVKISNQRFGFNDEISTNEFTNGTHALTALNYQQGLTFHHNQISSHVHGVRLETDSTIPSGFVGQIYILSNIFDTSGIGVDIHNSSASNSTIQIGNGSGSNQFLGNGTYIKLNSGVTADVSAPWNVWGAGALFSLVETHIDHKGIYPTGNAGGFGAGDNSGLGQVSYAPIPNPNQLLTLNFPNVAHPSRLMVDGVPANFDVTANYEPYGVASVFYRLAPTANTAADTCPEQYSQPGLNLGTGTPLGGNDYTLSFDSTGYPEGVYLLCAFMTPGVGMTAPVDPAGTFDFEHVIIDRSPPAAVTNVGWIPVTPSSNIANVLAATGYRGCSSWVNHGMVTSGAIVWSDVPDPAGISTYYLQGYSTDYGPGTLSFTTSVGTPNYFHLALMSNGTDDGNYYFRVSAGDNLNYIGPWSHPSLNSENWCLMKVDTVAPSVSLPNYTVNEGNTGFIASATSNDANTVAQHNWDLDGNGSLETSGGASINIPSSILTNQGVRNIAVQATDPAGNSTLANATVTVLNVAPAISGLSSRSIIAGQSAAMNFNLTDPGAEGSWNVNVNYGDGSSTNFNVSSTGTINIPAHLYSTAGNYTVTVSVSDGTVTSNAVANVNVAASQAGYLGASISASGTFRPGQNIQFSAVLDNPNNFNVTGYSWQFGDNTTATTASTAHSYTIPGTYTVNLTVNTSNGPFNASTTVTILTGDSGAISLNAGANRTVTLGQSVSLTAEVDGTESDEMTFSWNLGDGTTRSGQSVNYTYAAVGTYNVTVTATRGDLTLSDSTTVTVNTSQGRIDIPNEGLPSDQPSVLGASDEQAQTPDLLTSLFSGLPMGWPIVCGASLLGLLMLYLAYKLWEENKQSGTRKPAKVDIW